VNKLLCTLTPGFETSILRVAVQGGLHRKKPRSRDPMPAATAAVDQQGIPLDVPPVPGQGRTLGGPQASSDVEAVARPHLRAPPVAEAEAEEVEAQAAAQVGVVETVHPAQGVGVGEGLAAVTISQ
jgi:hypothetical protein